MSRLRFSHFIYPALASLLVLVACDSTSERRPAPKRSGNTQTDAGQNVSSMDAAMGTVNMDAGSVSNSDAGQGTLPSGLAGLAPKSNGMCPSFGSSSPVTFSSGGKMRRVAVLAPSARPVGMPILFVWHGLTTLDQRPVESMISGFNLQGVAESEQMIVVVAEALEQSIPLVGNIALWGILGQEADDLTLFDDLRTCLSEEYSADLSRVYSWGHSGGALWTSMLVINRSDSLAAATEFSGGSNFSIIGLGGPFIEYQKPASLTPVLLASGGSSDVWPDQFALIRFEETTGNLQQGLLQDGHTVVRCRHELGHYQLPSQTWSLSMDWMKAHRFGEASTFIANNLSAYSSWCEAAQ